MRFSSYSFQPELSKSIVEAGFVKPTDIQYKAIPPIMKGDDVLAIAQTGTGKTAAFAIPMIHRLSTGKPKTGLRCLVMVPTRELAMQVRGVFDQLGKASNVKAMSIFGGVEQDPQIAGLLKGTDVLVATPGRMFDLVSQGFLKLDAIETLILDEADHMLDLGFIHDIRQLIRLLPQKRQTLFFSATIDAEIKKLAYSLVINPIRIQISPNDPVSKNIDHSVAYISMDDKRFFLERLIREHPDAKVLTFVRTKVRAERVSTALERVGIKSVCMHGDMDQKLRNESMGVFRKGEVQILIATDVSARGIDIPDVNYVVNYDIPEKPENYVHRIGRTGRGTQRGIAVSFCSPDEKPLLDEIAELIGKPIQLLKIDKESYDETVSLSNAVDHDWRKLIAENENVVIKKRKKKKK
ncbi:MAG: DEAD/DEAH box helicase [Bacteroidales bacterium]|nr:DEAD/DEAH box helicase [Bacteroidales bacterium]